MKTFKLLEFPKSLYIEKHNTTITIGGFANTDKLSNIMLLLVHSKGEKFSEKLFSYSKKNTVLSNSYTFK